MTEPEGSPGYRDPGEREYLLGRISHLKGLLVNLSRRSERLTRYEAAQILRTYPTHAMKPAVAKAWNEVIDTLCPPAWTQVQADQDRTEIDDWLQSLG